MGSLSSERPPMGFICTELNFHRPPGDAWNERTWSFPLIHELGVGLRLDRVVSTKEYPEDLIQNVANAAKILADKGCVGILTSCGFLAMAQQELSKRLPIPIATSSLLQIPAVQAFLPSGKVVGVITFDGDRLTPKHFEKLGIAHGERIPVVGTPPNGHLRRVERDGIPYVQEDLENELVECARRLLGENPNVGAILLECTQLPCFAKVVQQAVKLPVYDVFTMGEWFYSGLVRKNFAPWTEQEKVEATWKRPRTKEEMAESQI